MRSAECVVDLEFVLGLVGVNHSAEPAENASDAWVLLAEGVLGSAGPFCVRERTMSEGNSRCGKPREEKTLPYLQKVFVICWLILVCVRVRVRT